jgi:hypothetical protein
MRPSAIALSLFLSVVSVLAWCGTSVAQTDEGAATFASDVIPLVDRLGCNAAKCHGVTGGKGGLQLSLFAAEPRKDSTRWSNRRRAGASTGWSRRRACSC